MSGTLSKGEMEKVLELMFEDMKTMGLTTPDMEKNKEGILEAVCEGLLEDDNKFSWEDIKSENVQKKLMGAIVETAMKGPDKNGIFSASKENNEFVNELHKEEQEKKEPTNPKLAAKLTAMLALKIALDDVLKNDKNNNDPKNIDKLVNKFMDPFKKVLENKPESSAKKQLEEEIKHLEKQMKDTLTNMYGGDNPNIAGEIQTIIQGPIFGNIAGWTNQTIADPNSKAELVKEITYNAGEIDPLGKENTNKANGLLTSALEAVADTLNSYAYAPRNKNE